MAQRDLQQRELSKKMFESKIPVLAKNTLKSCPVAISRVARTEADVKQQKKVKMGEHCWSKKQNFPTSKDKGIYIAQHKKAEPEENRLPAKKNFPISKDEALHVNQHKKAESEESCWSTKENFPTSKEHEAKFDDKFRQFILSGKELTPSMLNQESGAKLSYNRPSSLIHRPFIVPDDPCKEALKAIENWKLSKPGPIQARRKVLSSPMQATGGLYSGSNAIAEAYKKIEILKQLRKKKENNRKVRFNLQVDDAPLHPADELRNLQKREKSEVKLKRISEINECPVAEKENSIKISSTEVVASTSVSRSSKCCVPNKFFTPCPDSYKLSFLEEPNENREVRVKLNFEDKEMKSKKEKNQSQSHSPIKSDIWNGILFGDVATARKVLLHLPEEEYSVIIVKQKHVREGAIKNPVSIILNEANETARTELEGNKHLIV
ncbi:uncharacterized protein LOC129220712 [Uloborus diversus]|uniref:uncharacterized protein LOC129220712 n=1 Tax=Uloborus diversus TaxID=327109 RepID=UPI00240A043B|nr:uncharacterized protein LOC129220712 [Uloborus diversus]